MLEGDSICQTIYMSLLVNSSCDRLIEPYLRPHCQAVTRATTILPSQALPDLVKLSLEAQRQHLVCLIQDHTADTACNTK